MDGRGHFYWPRGWGWGAAGFGSRAQGVRGGALCGGCYTMYKHSTPGYYHSFF